MDNNKKILSRKKASNHPESPASLTVEPVVIDELNHDETDAEQFDNQSELNSAENSVETSLAKEPVDVTSVKKDKQVEAPIPAPQQIKLPTLGSASIQLLENSTLPIQLHLDSLTHNDKGLRMSGVLHDPENHVAQMGLLINPNSKAYIPFDDSFPGVVLEITERSELTEPQKFVVQLPCRVEGKATLVLVLVGGAVLTDTVMLSPLMIASTNEKKYLPIDVNSKITKGFYGCVESIDRDGVRGWVLNAKNLHDPISVSIFINNENIGTAYSVIPRVDVGKELGRPVNAGFYFKWQNAKLPAWVKKEDGKHKAKLSFFFENTDYQLEALQPLPLIKDLRVWVDISEPAKLSGSQKKAVIDAFENQKIEFETITDDQVKAIAFYLPQFHPIPENDEWWGAGFTEWNNVAQGKSYFSGHYQPHVPADLGYYDLRLPEVRETQAELAKKYGIYGFCYYYYWFAGRRILERPLQEVLESGKPDFPFCICWANENWSRRWDGSEQDILLEQIHSPENDAKFIHDVIPILKDPRYIRVKGKPLLMIYRISLLPNPSETTRLWRKICQDEGLGDIYLCAAEAFGYTNPEKDGFDATVQFPPHGVRVATSVNSLVDDLPEDYNGVLYDYQEVVFNELNREIPAYKRFRGVMCSWDNTARKKKSGNIFVNATPENYEVWIHAAVDYTRNYLPEGERLVFINAWNEWAEGTHLEPDRKFGHGFLEATQRALGEHTDWRVLLDIAEKKQTFTPVEVHDWVKQLRTHLINYQQSLRYLAKIHKPLQRDMANRAVFVSAELLAMDEKNLREASGEGNIEQIGAANTTFGFTKLLVDRQHTLYVHGWAVAKNCNINEYAPSCLTLIRKSDFKQYFALATIRYKRPDIGQIKPEYKETECAASGFKAYLDLNNVEQGEYRLGMVYLDSVLNHIGVLSYSVTYFKGELTIV